MDIYEKIKNGDYDSKLHYPTHEEEREAIQRVKDTFVGTLVQIESEIARVGIEIDAKRGAYRNDTDHLQYRVFKKDLLAEYGVTNNPKAEKAWSMAWDRGHSSGLTEVVHEFRELVELIK